MSKKQKVCDIERERERESIDRRETVVKGVRAWDKEWWRRGPDVYNRVGKRVKFNVWQEKV